ncbi:CaiB/BaiF CoA transferase family protein [Pseudonocardia acidicola]|uniref:CoA transferase n=1 Tax=Pseudonocardia acidicola TaxID=2724939 RepID=A0ABX1S365_9PSEU|nr:CaiB/BaiF CoA-transferase family protein [Pseudonocardia acidicola]NMH95951.1 CoA transferase [Pseudonocardia acidicola]
MSEPQAPGGPLAGVTVVALEQAVSAPLCTRTLADLGARVIKVENPRGGDIARDYDDVVNGLAAHFVWVNRAKESVTLNLKEPAGLDVLHRLLAEADVLVSNLAPGATARLGIAAADVEARHPHLVALEISGYGTGGPLSDRRAYDLLVQAESGACSITGRPGAPAKPGPPMADACTGLYAAISILATLHDRGRTGRGSTVAVSMFDTMTELMGYALNHTRHTGVDQEPVGMGSPAVSPYGAYRTADAQTVVLGTTNDQEWQRLAGGMMGRPDLAADERFLRNPDRVVHRDLLDAQVAAWCARHDLAEVQAAANAAGIGNARYNTPSDVVTHPHLTARDRWREIDSPVGKLPALLPPPIIAGHEPVMGAVPGLGEHTDAVLAGVGLSEQEIAELRACGAIGPAYVPADQR